jgi:putative transposase
MRLPRNVVPGQALHIIQRGNNRQPVFFSETDYRYYHESLIAAADRYACNVHAYVFMTNHVHLLLTPTTEIGPSRLMQAVGRRYVRYVNGVYRRTGTLWEGRFKSAIIDSERYLLVCSRYIELNPVRANMVSNPADYMWSSYQHNALGKSDEVLVPHALYSQLGESDAQRMAAYASLFDGCLEKEVLTRLRSGKEAGGVIGNNRFREQIEQVLQRRVEKCAHGGDRKSDRYRRSSGSSTLTP